jgi:hypothetical protein
MKARRHEGPGCFCEIDHGELNELSAFQSRTITMEGESDSSELPDIRQQADLLRAGLVPEWNPFCPFADSTPTELLDALHECLKSPEPKPFRKSVKILSGYCPLQLCFDILQSDSPPRDRVTAALIFIKLGVKNHPKSSELDLPPDYYSILCDYYPHPAAIEAVAAIIQSDAPRFNEFLAYLSDYPLISHIEFLFSLPEVIEPAFSVLLAVLSYPIVAMYLTRIMFRLMDHMNSFSLSVRILAFAALKEFCRENLAVIAEFLNRESLTTLFLLIPHDPVLLSRALKLAESITAVAPNGLKFLQTTQLNVALIQAIPIMSPSNLRRSAVILSQIVETGSTDAVNYLFKCGLIEMLWTVIDDIDFGSLREIAELAARAIAVGSTSHISQFLRLGIIRHFLAVMESLGEDQCDEQDIFETAFMVIAQFAQIEGGAHPDGTPFFSEEEVEMMREVAEEEERPIVGPFLNAIMGEPGE